MTKLADTRYELHPSDARYPRSLLDLSQPPETLYVRGNLDVLEDPGLAVIGSRKPTPYGIAVAEMAATVAAQSGITVVSGGARGCDQAAGKAALAERGRHVIVLGTGADVTYPPSSARLIERTLETGGAVVSIERWGTQPRPYAFPKRNAIIAALARAVFVAEAGMPSGTFSTADAANKLGREILSVPGSILSPESRGSNYLISVGATIIVDEESLEVAVSRIFETLRFSRIGPAEEPGMSEAERRILDALVANPMRIDEIAAMLGVDAVSCLNVLSGLQMTGRIERIIDGRFAPTKRALHARGAIMHNR